MQVRIRETGAVMYEGEFRALHANTSFPAQLSEQLINDMGADVVFEGPQATPTMYQVAFADGVQQIDGKWYTKYSVADMDADGIAAVDAQRKAANAGQAKTLLEETDWADLASVRNTAVTPHLTNSADFDTYRLALRAIVVNPPVTVSEWPTRPTAAWSS
jgi:hypothetical protein